MRLRSTQGVRKRYVEEPATFDDEDGPIYAPDDQSKDDDDFDEQSEAQPHVEDYDKEADGDDATSGDDDAAPGRGGAAEAKADTGGQPKRQRSTGAGMA